MRTTLDLPENLILEVMELTGEKTKSAAIIRALEDKIKTENQKKLLRYKGKIDLDINLDELRQRNGAW
jgi:Arc/MetJ family transcription regulator